MHLAIVPARNASLYSASTERPSEGNDGAATRRNLPFAAIRDRAAYGVSAANLKAVRRTKDPACGFGTEVELRANDHAPKMLLAASPNLPGSQPLVLAHAPIKLGMVQAIRPYQGVALGVNLDV